MAVSLSGLNMYMYCIYNVYIQYMYNVCVQVHCTLYVHACMHEQRCIFGQVK